MKTLPWPIYCGDLDVLVEPGCPFEGQIIDRTHRDFDAHRAIFNGMIDRHPLAIAYPESNADLLSIGRWVLTNDIPFSIRAGGHNVAGTSLIDDGYVIDTSRLYQVKVDRSQRTAQVDVGALWRDFDSSCAKFNLCTPGGIISDTGVAGLTLGGGIGWLNGLYGLSCDNLKSADVLLANGDLVVASEDENPELLWALRGGGGNFGLVTQFRFDLHPLPSLVAGSIVTDGDDFEDAVARYKACCDEAPDELTASFVAFTGPNKARISIDLCLVTDGGLSINCTKYFEPPRKSQIIRDTRQRYSYVNWQRQFDDDRRRGRRSYWRAMYIADLGEPKFVKVVKEYLLSAPSEHSMLTIDHIHGATHRASEVSSCFGNRTNKYLFLINTNWDSASDDRANLNWSDSLFQELTQFGPLGTYVNYLSREGADRASAAFGGNIERLRNLKAQFDPMNKFRSNQNIRPK